MEQEKQVPQYIIEDMDENIDGSSTVLIKSDGVYYMLTNFKDEEIGLEYDLVIGRDTPSGVVWMAEGDNVDEYLKVLDEILEDVLAA